MVFILNTNILRCKILYIGVLIALKVNDALKYIERSHHARLRYIKANDKPLLECLPALIFESIVMDR